MKASAKQGRSVVAQEANRMLDKIRVGINKAYQGIMDRDGYVSAEKVRNAFLGMGQNQPCYANCRHGIKAVAKLCGINKNVCWH